MAFILRHTSRMIGNMTQCLYTCTLYGTVHDHRDVETTQASIGG